MWSERSRQAEDMKILILVKGIDRDKILKFLTILRITGQILYKIFWIKEVPKRYNNVNLLRILFIHYFIVKRSAFLKFHLMDGVISV